MLARFNIIVSVDSKGGIAKDGELAWHQDDNATNQFRELTIGRGRNAVIMGRKTYELIPPEKRPLKNRKCIVISRAWNQAHHTGILVYPTLLEALAGAAGPPARFEEIFIAGGEMLYDEAVRRLLYLCNKIYVTTYRSDYQCDQFFPIDLIKDFPLEHQPFITLRYIRNTYAPAIVHQEYRYMNLLDDILQEGEGRHADDIGVIHSLFGETLEFDISKKIPAFTTRKLHLSEHLRELLWTIRGQVDAKQLEMHGATHWRRDANKAALAKKKLDYPEYEVGPSHGFLWRHWGAKYEGNADYTGKGYDQLHELIEGIKNRPFSRENILSGWDSSCTSSQPLPPNDLLFHFYVSADRQNLDMQVYLRCVDAFAELPGKVFQYAVFAHMVGFLVNLRPRRLIVQMGEAYIHKIQFDGVQLTTERTPRPWPTYMIEKPQTVMKFEDFGDDTFRIVDYDPWPHVPLREM
jgi:thymidylate synthase